MDKKFIEYEDGHRVELDEDDAPELDAAFFANARPGNELEAALQSARGRMGRPMIDSPRKQVTLRLEPDVLAWLRGTGKGWQSRVNALLRVEMAKSES